MKAQRGPARHRLAACLRSDIGGSAIEFALWAPLMFFIILGTFELALDMVVDASVQLAAQTASRAGLTTAAPATATRADEAQQIVMSRLGMWTRIGASVTISAQSYSTYSDVGTASYQDGLGGLGDVVLYKVSLTMPGFSGIPQLLGIKSMTFQRNYLVQNEQ
jgi:Flp pilus assembly protein TadG